LKVAAVVLVACCAFVSSASRAAAPAAFQPRSFTAVSEHDYWLLGSTPCARGECWSILRTRDAGRTFARRAAPQLPSEGETPTLRFADHSDGYAFVLGNGGVFYSTHDGGATWQKRALRTVIAFATGGGYAYLVTAHCTLSGCTSFRFQRSPVTRDAWSSATMPVTPDGSIANLAAHGTNLWLLATPRHTRGPNDKLARSADAGQTFVARGGPCYAGLGGDLEPTSARVVWAVCPGGNLAAAARSTDGGIRFKPLRTPPLVNSAQLAPASATVAVLARGDARFSLLRTTNAGRTWTRAATPRGATYAAFIGFTDAKVGAAIVQLGATRTALWRTSDSGAHWHTVRLP
jgi:hypothetical protein